MIWIEMPIEDMSAFYPSEYYSFEPITLTKPRGAAAKVKRGLNRWRISQACNAGHTSRVFSSVFPPVERSSLRSLRLVDLSMVRSILDIGSGSGRFLSQLARLGRYDLLGIDPYQPESILYDSRFRIENTDVFSLDGTFDLITLNHSLEHMSHHVRVLKKIRTLLNPSGRCLVRVPLSSAYTWSLYHIHWAQLDAPRHLIVHTRSSFSIAAREAGFDIERIVFDSSEFQISASERYLRGEGLINNSTDVAWAADTLGIEGSQRSFQRRMRKRVETLNRWGLGDQAIFCLSPQ